MLPSVKPGCHRPGLAAGRGCRVPGAGCRVPGALVAFRTKSAALRGIVVQTCRDFATSLRLNRFGSAPSATASSNRDRM